MKSVSSSRKLFPVVAAPKVSAGERSEPKRTEGAATTAALARSASPPLSVAGNSEVVAKASRRRFMSWRHDTRMSIRARVIRRTGGGRAYAQDHRECIPDRKSVV